ncbi:MAG TPA: sigma-70 family RNA polymerase sigma factor [Polyangium sp.]|nr:sigma-70 family RNA polymerase sigma factor [Polyangium sp.]
MLAPEDSARILLLRPDITRFICARRRRKRVETPDVEDEVQEALTEIMCSVSHYRAELGSFRPWVFGIVLNVHCRFARNRKRHRDCFSDQEIDTDQYAAPDPSPERRMQIKEARGHLEHVNRDMPEAQYAALYLRVVEGHSHAKIGDELGISEHASKQLVHRARRYLAKRGLNEEAFFTSLPVVTELSIDDRRASWRETYDWCFRLGHALALFMALTLAAPIEPLAVAKARLTAFVQEHVVVQDQPALVPDEPRISQDEPALHVEKTPRIAAAVVRNVSAPPHQSTAASAKPRFQAKPYDLSLMVRKNP